MKKILTILSVLLACSVNTYSQTKDNSALKFSLEWGDDFSNSTPEQKQPYLDTLNAAISMVKMFPPTGDNLFNWIGDRTILKGKTFTVYYTMSTDPYVKKLATEAKQTIDTNVNAITLILGKNANSIKIYLCVFSDKVFFDASGTERKDGLTRLTVALAHEIYGHVQEYLKMNFAKDKFRTEKEEEIAAYTASVNFINRVLAALKDPSSKLYKMSTKQKMITDYTNVLKSEKTLLDQWKKS